MTASLLPVLIEHEMQAHICENFDHGRHSHGSSVNSPPISRLKQYLNYLNSMSYGRTQKEKSLIADEAASIVSVHRFLCLLIIS